MLKKRCPKGTRFDKVKGGCVSVKNKADMPKECGPGKILNPKTNRCVSLSSKIGKELAKKNGESASAPKLKRCPNGTRRNKKTGECVPKTKPPSAPKPKTPNAPKPKTPNAPKPKTPSAPKPKTPSAPKSKTPSDPKPKTPQNVVKRFKIKSALRPIIDKVVKQDNLHIVNHMGTPDMIDNAYIIDSKKNDKCKWNYNISLRFKWLSDKYKNMMNGDIHTVTIRMKKDTIDYSAMDLCMDKNSDSYKGKRCMLNGAVNYAKLANDVLKEGKRFYVTYISIQKARGGHANLLIHDLKKNTIFRFEPHGSDSEYTNVRLDVYLKKRIMESYEKMGIDDKPEYLNTEKVLPCDGPQYYDLWDKGYGRCAYWCLAFLNYRIKYPNLTVSQIHKYLGNNTRDATHFIKRYMSYLRKQKFVINLQDKKAFQKRLQNDSLYL